ncbi:MAG: prolyl oligopeptidase family serine peptidase [Flavitalea sp.]
MKIKKLWFAALILLTSWLPSYGQKFSMDAVTSYPFPSELTSNPAASKIAVAINEKGKRNIYVAEGPAYALRKLTSYDEDEGLEITGIKITPDGSSVVYVRGGDHGAYDESMPRNPSGKTTAPRVQIFVIPFAGGKPVLIDDGDYPSIHPSGNTVAYIKNDQVWSASLKGVPKPLRLFYARGSSDAIEWSPDGSKMVFVSARGRHSFIGIYTDSLKPIQWLAPDFARDQSPKWTPDGKKIVFARTFARGGYPDSLTADHPDPWSLMVVDVASGSFKKIWQSPATLRGSVPDTHGRYNLRAAAGGKIVFMSYQDGWPHLYSIDSSGGAALQLTAGNFMSEHIQLSPDGTFLLASANTGPDKEDYDRRHIIKIPVAKKAMEVLTPGTGIEAFPVLSAKGNEVVYVSATASRPGVLAMMDLTSKKQKLIGEKLIPADFPVASMIIPKTVQFKASDGLTVYGQLFEPAVKSAGEKKPAILFIHGGPSRQMLVGWHYGDYYSNTYAINQYLASQGFVVLSLNYRLGIGYGYEFQHPLLGGYFGASEYLDVKAAGEWLVNQPGVDASKIGVYGGSYGGFLTALALGRDSKLFAAGVDIHGVHNHLNFSPSLAGEQAPDAVLARKMVWESSPVSWVDGMTSPILFIHGDDDGNVEFDESIDLIRRFQQKNKPFESLVIPDETHHWMRYQNIVTVDKAIAEFLIRKLK